MPSRVAKLPYLSRATTRVQSTIATKVSEAGQSESARLGGRSDESIRRIMDANKGAIFAIYNRALRVDPQLRGKLVFEMVIDSAGSVVQITLVSSELSDAALASKILSRIRLINFGAEDVVNTRVNTHSTSCPTPDGATQRGFLIAPDYPLQDALFVKTDQRCRNWKRLLAFMSASSEG